MGNCSKINAHIIGRIFLIGLAIILIAAFPIVKGINVAKQAEHIDREELAFNLERIHKDFAGDGVFFDSQNGCYRNYKDARICGELAALGNLTYQRTLSSLYFYGIGVEQDYVAAAYWAERAANQGSTGAMNATGYLYWKYLGDPVVGRAWLEQALNLGDADSEKIIKRLTDSQL